MIITTKYIGPTNYRPGRVKASLPTFTGPAISATLEWDHSKNIFDNHKSAMLVALAKWDARNPGHVKLRNDCWTAHDANGGGYLFVSLIPGEQFNA